MREEGDDEPHARDIIIGVELHFPRQRDVPRLTRGGIFYFPSGREAFVGFCLGAMGSTTAFGLQRLTPGPIR